MPIKHPWQQRMALGARSPFIVLTEIELCAPPVLLMNELFRSGFAPAAFYASPAAEFSAVGDHLVSITIHDTFSFRVCEYVCE